MPALLLIHAFPMDASMWDAQLEALPGELPVLAPSLPGFGGTPLPHGALTVQAMAGALVAELDRVGVDRTVVCGVSMGGYAAFELWRSHRHRVAGLLLADTRAEADDEAGRARRRELAEKVRAGGSDVVADDPPPLLSARADPGLWETVKATIRRQPPEAIARASLGMAERPDARDLLPGIDVPATVLCGSEDTLTPLPMSEAMAASVPGAELVVIEGAGHLANVEAPRPFTEAIRRLLDRAG